MCGPVPGARGRIKYFIIVVINKKHKVTSKGIKMWHFLGCADVAELHYREEFSGR